MKNEYIIISKFVTAANPQANSLIEKIQQVISSLVHTFNLKNTYLEKDNPRSGIIEATDFVLRRTYHTTL